MANLSFMAGGRRRRLYRRKPSGPYHVRFEINGKDTVRSLGTTNESAAKENAKAIIEAEISGDVHTSRKMKVKSDYCTLQEIADVYVAKFGRDRRTTRTARGNVGALEKIVRVATGLNLDARSTILDGELIRKFEATEEARIEKDRRGHVVQESELRIRTSIGSWVRQARSIFKTSHMDWFEDLALPDLKKFRDQGVTAPERPRPRPLDEGVIDQVNAAAPALKLEDPACYASHLLFTRLGMRNIEQVNARRSWITRNADGSGKLGVIYRPEEGFKPKKKTERWIPIGPKTLAEIDALAEPGADGYLVPALHKTDRENIVYDRHSAWAGKWIKDRSKVSYELRRYAGSLIYKKTGKIEHVQQFLGHADVKTTMEWYWYLLEETPSLDAEDFAAPAAEPDPHPQFSVVA
jgi:integrase